MRATEAIERVLPYDGPHSADTVTDAAYAISRLVRYLNNATQGAGLGHVGNGQTTLAKAPTVHDVLGGVEDAVYGLDQLLRQIVESLRRLDEDDSLYDDRRDRPATWAAGGAADRVALARRAASDLADDLRLARGFTVHLGHDHPGGGDLR